MSNVLHLIDSAGMYGAEKVVLTLLEELRDSPFPGILGCICENDAEPPLIAKKAEAAGIPVKYFIMKRGLDFSGVRDVLNFIQDHGIRLVHSHGYKPNILLGVIPGKKFKVISTVHGWAKQTAGMKGKFYEFLDAIALKRMDRVIAVSRAVQGDLLGHGLKARKISLVYNGIKIGAPKSSWDVASARRKFGFPDDVFVIGSVGRLATVKGHSYLIEAMPSILNEVKSCQLMIAGEGPLRVELEALISKLGLSKTVKLVGHIDDIDQFMAAIDLFVLPSLSEGLPIALLEAIASEKPVLASSVGGIPEVITNSGEGVLILPANAEAISLAICRLLKHREQLEELSVNSRKRVENMFSSSKMAMDYSAIYASLVSPSESSAIWKGFDRPAHL
ncbi:MAG: glycosyltransferase [Candidatus Manganitrophus sp. SA1]|nr:glycosyltransferase [Candidatus Manganitrophus morganii]